MVPSSPQGGSSLIDPQGKVLPKPADPQEPRAAPSTGTGTPPAAGFPLDAAPRPNPVVQETRELLDRGEYRSAVLAAFRAAFRDTVRAYALSVPVGCTDRRFVREFLRPDMGKLATLLPELYRTYEPVRFGTTDHGDGPSFLALVERIYSETSLGTIYRPNYQPTGPKEETAESVWPFLSSTKGGGPR